MWPGGATHAQPGAARAGDQVFDDRPNIILFLVDDMRSDELTYMPKTRALLGAQGVTFPNNISPHPLCCPARAELVTGQYAQNNGVQHNNGPLGGYHALTSRNNVAKWLKGSGYQTAYLGKYLNQYQPDDARPAGWDVWSPLVGPTADYYSFRFFGQDLTRDSYITTEIEARTNALIRYFADHNSPVLSLPIGRSPFYLFVNHTAPHNRNVQVGKHTFKDRPPPSDPQVPAYGRLFGSATNPATRKPSFNRPRPGEQRLNARGQQKLFQARIRSLQSVDDAMASMVATLTVTGELDNTYIVFASDNGYALGEHAQTGKNILTEEVLDVPMLIRGPQVRKGATVNQVTSLVDLPATFLTVAGLRPKKPIDGLPLVSLLRGTSKRWRDTTLVQTGNSDVRGVKYKGWESRGVQTSRYLYQDFVNQRDGERLYDRQRDRFELKDRSHDPRYRATMRELRQRYTKLRNCKGQVRCNRIFGRVPGPR